MSCSISAFLSCPTRTAVSPDAALGRRQSRAVLRSVLPARAAGAGHAKRRQAEPHAPVGRTVRVLAVGCANSKQDLMDRETGGTAGRATAWVPAYVYRALWENPMHLLPASARSRPASRRQRQGRWSVRIFHRRTVARGLALDGNRQNPMHLLPPRAGTTRMPGPNAKSDLGMRVTRRRHRQDPMDRERGGASRAVRSRHSRLWRPLALVLRGGGRPTRVGWPMRDPHANSPGEAEPHAPVDRGRGRCASPGDRHTPCPAHKPVRAP